MTKKAVMVTRPDTALEMVLRAYKTAVSGRPGPVVVQIPFDIQHTEIELDHLPDLLEMDQDQPSRPGSRGDRCRSRPDRVERAAADRRQQRHPQLRRLE